MEWTDERSKTGSKIQRARGRRPRRGRSHRRKQVEKVVGRPIAENVARAVDELFLHLVKPFRGDPPKSTPLGKILPHQPVVVLRPSLLPKPVGLAEVALAVQQPIDEAVHSKLQSAVVGDARHRESPEDRDNPRRCLCTAFAIQPSKLPQAALAFVEGEQIAASPDETTRKDSRIMSSLPTGGRLQDPSARLPLAGWRSHAPKERPCWVASCTLESGQSVPFQDASKTTATKMPGPF